MTRPPKASEAPPQYPPQDAPAPPEAPPQDAPREATPEAPPKCPGVTRCRVWEYGSVVTLSGTFGPGTVRDFPDDDVLSLPGVLIPVE